MANIGENHLPPFPTFPCLPTISLDASDPTKSRLYILYKSGVFSDFTLYYSSQEEEKEFKVHKNILFSASDFFQRMLSEDWQEKHSASLSLTDTISCSVFEVFIIYLSTCSINEKFLHKNLFSLYKLSDFYGVPELKKIVLREMEVSIKIKNIDEYIDFRCALGYDEEIGNILVDFVSKKWKKLAKKGFHFHKLEQLVDKIFNLIAEGEQTRCFLISNPMPSMPSMPSMLPMLPMPPMPPGFNSSSALSDESDDESLDN